MALSSAQKAALLLMTLDNSTAAELLKGVNPDRITEIAAEMSAMGKSTPSARQAAAEPIREFIGLVYASKNKSAAAKNDPVAQLLENALGKGKSLEVLSRLDEVLQNRDPFGPIRSASNDDITAALAGESPQVAALVLSEMPPRKAIQLLPMLDDSAQAAVVRGMTGGTEVSLEARQKVAAVMRDRLVKMHQKVVTAPGAAPVAAPTASSAPAAAAAAKNRRNQQLRKVALLLRGLTLKLRDTMLKSITDQDSQVGATVRKMMVAWEDMPIIGERALQNVMRTVDSRKLALSLVNTDPAIVAKIRANISERAAAMLDEETSLLNKPKAEDIEQSRETILDTLRALNDKGELPLEGGE